MAKKKYNVIREEMLQVASSVAQEKNIDQDSVFSAMEQALEKAARVKYGQEIDIRISIDRTTGDIKLNSYLEVVESVDEELQSRQILLEDALKTNPDIVTWSDNQATFLANALAPAEVSKIFLYEEKNKVEVVIPDDQLSLAIGRKGQNVKLASNLTSLEIDILTEDEESERRQQEFKEKSVLLAEILDVEDVIAQLLVTDGYTTVESIATETLDNLEKIEGFDTNIAQEIIDRSKSFVKDKEESDKKLIEEKINDEKLKNLKGMNNSILAELAKSNILNVNDFADLATFELIDKDEGILKELDIDEEIANNMIMEARSFWSEGQS
ncbi:helix-hairpin-helix domain-containing protein [Pelagibacteraceae bacterium]|nr:helix-hairpin-helix domain-containing protein [Pelagibacteraceae bacterium]